MRLKDHLQEDMEQQTFDFNEYTSYRLKTTQKTVLMVEYGDLENFINKIFFHGKSKYEIPMIEEMGNDSAKTYDVDGTINSWDKDDIDRLLNGDDKVALQIVLEYLCSKGAIKKGEYVVNVSW